MTPLDDHSQQRQPLFFPVVIATALLTIIGMVGGYLLSRRGGGGSGNEPVPVPTHTQLPAGQACLGQTQEMGVQAGSNGELRQVMRVRTDSRTVVWICQDDDGELFYHANKGGAEAPWVENKTALFLAGVQHDGQGEFWATAANGTVFRVNSDRLVIEHTNGRVEEQEVVPE
ncbi:hypothetical protein [Actinoplanes italicus]|uniref:hypothetical protein n=1 Tax=Actinoplanes italicus TaxID=113567 RepID=UPI001EF230B3|nr:hypothetical protein [Actinoplanes italicus]